MRRQLSPEVVRRLSDLAVAQKLAQNGHVAAARSIFARYGISYAIVEIDSTSAR